MEPESLLPCSQEPITGPVQWTKERISSESQVVWIVNSVIKIHIYQQCDGGDYCSSVIVTEESTFEGVFKSFRSGRLERELQMSPLSATRCSGIVILWISLVLPP
jgi:hypothetical protein